DAGSGQRVIPIPTACFAKGFSDAVKTTTCAALLWCKRMAMGVCHPAIQRGKRNGRRLEGAGFRRIANNRPAYFAGGRA
ncbi:MAG: hypothetical protein OEV34_16645, partial [Gammaproteobacteria bacterium]|nr:hypothetical protein [Gammaproteobacteria bacterium]